MDRLNKEKHMARHIAIGMLCTGLLCMLIAISLNLSRANVIEEVAVDQLLQEYWQAQFQTQLEEQNLMLHISEPLTAATPSIEVTGSEVSDGDEAQQPSNEEDMTASSPDENELKAPAASTDGKININIASADELQQLKGIGPSKANAIVNDRELKGAFKNIEDIKRVKGIGEKLYAGIKESIVASP